MNVCSNMYVCYLRAGNKGKKSLLVQIQKQLEVKIRENKENKPELQLKQMPVNILSAGPPGPVAESELQ